MTSTLVRAALEQEKQIRRAFADYREAIYARAHEACHGRLLNARGLRAGIDSRQLFESNRRYFEAYASEELLEHMRRHRRLTFDQFIHQHIEEPAA